MKKLVMISLCLFMLTTISMGCSSKKSSSDSDSNTTEKQIPDLTGEWKQENSKSDDSYQSATIITVKEPYYSK